MLIAKFIMFDLGNAVRWRKLLERFSKKFLSKITSVGYTSEGKYNKKLLSILADESLFLESFVVTYGFPKQQKKEYLQLPTFYIDTPYERGKVFFYGSTVSQTPITFFINIESKCVNVNEVKKAVEMIKEETYSLYLFTPFTSNEMTTLYRESVGKIFKELGIGIDLIHPSYTLVIGKNRVFRDSPYTTWSLEILAALTIEITTGRNNFIVKNTECVDTIPKKIKGFEKIYIEKLVKDILNMFEVKKIIDLNQKKKYLNELAVI